MKIAWKHGFVRKVHSGSRKRCPPFLTIRFHISPYFASNKRHRHRPRQRKLKTWKLRFPLPSPEHPIFSLSRDNQKRPLYDSRTENWNWCHWNLTKEDRYRFVATRGGGGGRMGHSIVRNWKPDGFSAVQDLMKQFNCNHKPFQSFEKYPWLARDGQYITDCNISIPMPQIPCISRTMLPSSTAHVASV